MPRRRGWTLVGGNGWARLWPGWGPVSCQAPLMNKGLVCYALSPDKWRDAALLCQSAWGWLAGCSMWWSSVGGSLCTFSTFGLPRMGMPRLRPIVWNSSALRSGLRQG